MLGSFLRGSSRRKRKASWADHDDQGSPLLKETSVKTQKETPGTYREVFSPQSNVNLIVYSILSLHAVAYDQVNSRAAVHKHNQLRHHLQLLPVFMHLPVQDHHHQDTKPWLKFSGGFGLDASCLQRPCSTPTSN